MNPIGVIIQDVQNNVFVAFMLNMPHAVVQANSIDEAKLRLSIAYKRLWAYEQNHIDFIVEPQSTAC